MYWGTGSAAEFAAETAEFAHQVFGIDTELGEQARVFVGVDLVRQFLSAWSVLFWSPFERTISMTLSLSMSMAGVLSTCWVR